LDVSIVVGTVRAVGLTVDIDGMMCVSHGIVTTTFEDAFRNSSMVSVPPNIFNAGLLGAVRQGTYLFPLACLRINAMYIWISPDFELF
jgi:hypothetical protein